MLVRIIIALSVMNIVRGGLFELIVKKDEEARKLIEEPQGVDEDLFERLRFVTDTFYRLIRELRVKKRTAKEVAIKLYERGYPALLSQVFKIEDLQKYYNWTESDRRYFYSLYGDVRKKWVTFETLALTLQGS